MSAPAARVLLLGRSPDVMEAVLQELEEAGIPAKGSTEPERAPEAFDACDFELIAFGGGLKGTLSDKLKAAFAMRNSEVRFLDTLASVAVREIIDSLNGAAVDKQIDLDAYCARIGYRGPRTPTLETLRALAELHPASIPFEAIDVLLEKGVDLSPAAVDAKLIGARRGGYCYEQNGLFKRVLETMGFTVDSLLARVRWRVQAGAPLPVRSHMALRVMIDGVSWLADVGFGGYMPTAPLRMDSTEARSTRHETYRLIPFAREMLLQMRENERWVPVYELSPEAQFPVDFEAPNWFTATHPSSHFRRNLIVARSMPDARYRLLDNRLTIQAADGAVERRSLTADAIEEALANIFELPVAPEWRPVIEKAAAAPTGD